MQQPGNMSNTDRGPRLMDLLPEAGSAGFGAALLRMAHTAAALHRAQLATQGAQPWQGLTALDLTNMDKAGHGSPADSRSSRTRGAVTTEGDR